MKAFVTGSTGLLGSNLVHALIDAGYEVKALVRSTEKAQKILGHLDIELVKGDMLNVDAFAAQMADCDVLFHCAAYFREYYSSGEHENLLEKINVEGTINILNAAENQGVKKTIYVSSGGVIGQANSGDISDESASPDLELMSNLYFRSKVVAEEKIAEWLKSHQMPVVLALPTAMYGPRDAAPTTAGQIIIDFIHGDLPAIPPGGFEVVDARDVADGMIRAVEKGKSGERYILSADSCTLKEILALLVKITGRPKPPITLSYPFALAFAYFSEFMGRITGNEPLATVNGIRTLQMRRTVTSAKAQRELGVTFRPFEETLRDEVQWYLDNGYIKQEQLASVRQKMVLEA